MLQIVNCFCPIRIPWFLDQLSNGSPGEFKSGCAFWRGKRTVVNSRCTNKGLSSNSHIFQGLGRKISFFNFWTVSSGLRWCSCTWGISCGVAERCHRAAIFWTKYAELPVTSIASEKKWVASRRFTPLSLMLAGFVCVLSIFLSKAENSLAPSGITLLWSKSLPEGLYPASISNSHQLIIRKLQTPDASADSSVARGLRRLARDRSSLFKYSSSSFSNNWSSSAPSSSSNNWRFLSWITLQNQ